MIKSKDRVRHLGEVFTAETEVNAMLDLLNDKVWSSIECTFLEPSCGDGNFLEKVLQRKLLLVPKTTKRGAHKIEYLILRVIGSIYGIDISEENVFAARQRLKQEILDFWSNTYNTTKMSPRFVTIMDQILSRNIQVGNTLNAPSIDITEWVTPTDGTFKPKVFCFADLQNSRSTCKREERLITYYKEKE